MPLPYGIGSPARAAALLLGEASPHELELGVDSKMDLDISKHTHCKCHVVEYLGPEILNVISLHSVYTVSICL